MADIFYARCRVCTLMVIPGKPCEHLDINDLGQAYQVHGQHQLEPDPYAEVQFGPDPTEEPPPSELLLAVQAKVAKIPGSKTTPTI